MAKVRKLKSGSWFVQVMVNGQRESFTIDDPTPAGKRKCQKLADEWIKNYKARIHTQETIKEAIEFYIKKKETILSPTTIRSYKSLAENAFDSINHCNVETFNIRLAQLWLDEYNTKHKPKSVRNAAGLLTAAYKLSTGVILSLKLPESGEKDYYIPSDDNIKDLIAYAHDSDPVLERAIMLAAFGTLRRGEVCALTYEDIKPDHIVVDKSIAWNGKEHVVKSPKTKSSVRTIELPPSVIESLTSENRPPTECVVPISPQALTQRFERAIKNVGCPAFRFHDLRAYAASIRHAIGIPDQYIMADGGWKTPAVMQRVYRRAMEEKRKEFAKKSNAYFDNIMSTYTE